MCDDGDLGKKRERRHEINLFFMINNEMEYFFSIFQGIWIMILLDFCPLHTTFQ